MDTIIISAFPGCGKTYLSKKYNNDNLYIDKDNGHLTTELQFLEYANEIIDLIGKTKYILISQYPEVLNLLYNNGYKFVVVCPNNSSFITLASRNRIKQQWFGRFILRGNSDSWISNIMQHYDNWTSLSHLCSMHPSKLYLLNADEYLSDIIEEIEEISDSISN